MQEVIVNGNKGRIDVTCVFASGSRARGCVLFVDNMTNSSHQSINATRDNSSPTASAIFSVSHNGTYEVTAFDIEEDGSFDSSRRAKFTTHTVIDVPSLPPPVTSSALPVVTSEVVCITVVGLCLGVL